MHDYTPTTKSLSNDAQSAKRNRTKSSSIVAPRLSLVSPSVSSSNVKAKSKSASSDIDDIKTRLNHSKIVTPHSSKLSAPPTSRFISTPLNKRANASEMKSKLGSARSGSRTTVTSNSDVVKKETQSKQSTGSLLVKRKNAENRNETVNISRSRYLSSSNSCNDQLSSKKRTQSHSSTVSEKKTVTPRSRNLTKSCTDIKGKNDIRSLKLRSNSTSKSETSSLKSSSKSSLVDGVNENLPENNKLVENNYLRNKPCQPLTQKDRQNSNGSERKFTSKAEKSDTAKELPTSCLNSLTAPDLLKQTPEVTRKSVGIQVENHEQDGKSDVTDIDLHALLVNRNRDFEACLTALQVYAKKVEYERNNASFLERNLKFTKEKCHSTETMLAKENSQRVRLEEEMLSAKSDSAVEVALLRAQFERKQEIAIGKLKEIHRKELEKVRKQHVKSMDDRRRVFDLKLKRIEETYVEDISQINAKHKGEVAELELKHTKQCEDLVEERHAEIDIIKADYEEQLEQLQESLSQSEKACNELREEIKANQLEAKKDSISKIQDAVAKYKSLPDELDSMKFALELKNAEIKKLRKSNAELQHEIDELRQIKERAALLEREKESLNFVVENKSYFERQLSLERDKLRLSLDREVATSKRLSLEKEELAWRLNSFRDSPTSPTLGNDRLRMSVVSTPDSGILSHKIEESDLEYEINESKQSQQIMNG
ncbi:microtubule-associated tumor suppressor 1 homolog A-like [Xenia sp. Carnegie-2017]|uniref:microtubule-associated tumor suppressor 1 homolog A-like n=1 Tax=Xenia sp. Carnegie-2017 TaxID=2897299 RepID=UPI001F0475BB|nr:microtubule-associated tumor suppressor 1 homolog A-like [Xenia sp. Carnegie-2017]